ncbi:hydantoinase/oxoprolinase family protein [Dissulfurirhabdus thermomarina]|nr:hydantoinase/oxoprolinase family protein [Dissulfurirhabdus thermomarina]
MGVDTGGTFTDFFCRLPDGGTRRWKTLSTPSDPSAAVMEGLAALFPDLDPAGLEVVHGTTVGTNAFLERKGARMVLVTTRGFEDVLWIGRQDRPRLYDLFAARPAEILPRHRVTGVRERMTWRGEVLEPLSGEEVRRAVRFCRARGARSVAVCLLHAYAGAGHEARLGRALEAAGFPVSLSSRVLPEFREYERLSTTVINAYLGPVVGGYIERLRRRLEGARLLVQLSNGGCRPAAGVGAHAVQTLLSGPAGGVQAAWELGRALGFDRVLTLDMGGTSTDVALCDGGPSLTRDYRLEGYPVAVPLMDIHTVGAGGGSLAWVDAGGLLRVGPESAGADPGPVCYGKGTGITVTDANLFLGRLRPEAFLGGRLALAADRVPPRMAELAARVGLSPREAALGVLRLVDTHMVRALRAVSLERGHDPRGGALVCFGGAAGLHAAALAAELEIRTVILPDRAGVFSARGMAVSDLLFDGSTAFFAAGRGASDIDPGPAVRALAARLAGDIRGTGLDPAAARSEFFVDVRYRGQSYEVTVPLEGDWGAAFAERHRFLYGHDMPGAPLEVTAVRARARIPRGGADFREAVLPRPAAPWHGRRAPVEFEGGPRSALLLDRAALRPGERLSGPALVLDDFTTLLLPPGWGARVLDGGHVLMEREGERHDGDGN